MSKPRLTDEQLADPKLRDELVEVLRDMPMDTADDDGPKCRLCRGPLVILGTLGDVLQFRCRNCGADFSMDCGATGTNRLRRRKIATPKCERVN